MRATPKTSDHQSELRRDHRTFDPAREAYDEAVTLLKRELTHDECKRIWLEDKASMNDVQLAIIHAQAEYEKRSKQSHARTWLAQCSRRIMYYGNILDVLVQQSPEYVALIWGGMKFLFMVCLRSITNNPTSLRTRIGSSQPRGTSH